MILEFPDDPAVTYLDMQYMLGEKLMTAPIFNEEGHADYYLPGGTWTHLFSEEKREGNRWHSDDYDYFSLPIFVRENSLLPIGTINDRPDYDYPNNFELHLYEPKNGGFDKIIIPDIKGDPAVEISFRCENNEIVVKTSKNIPGLKLIIHRNEIDQYSFTGTEIKVDLNSAI